MKIPGQASLAGTDRYRKRFADKLPSEHFRQAQDLWLSSIGLGTYLGNYDDATDQQYHQAVVTAVGAGCNVIDSAINYRLQRSERSIGTALKELGGQGFNRDEIVVATKGGFIPYDGTPPKEPRQYIENTFIKTGLAGAADIVSGCHCMAPKYLLNQLDCSLRNLDVETIDIYYVHNPETQLGKVTAGEFDDRLVKAFESIGERGGGWQDSNVRHGNLELLSQCRRRQRLFVVIACRRVGRKGRRQTAPFQSHSIAAQPRHERSANQCQSAGPWPST